MAKSKKSSDKNPANLAPSGLTWKRDAFCREYLKDRNATQAAIRAGYAEKAAKEQGYRLLTNAHIKAQINKLARERARQLEIEANDVLLRLWEKATADVNELVRVERRCCRYCHGVDHEYQWKTAREFREHYDKEIRRQFGTDDPDKFVELGVKFDAGERIPGIPTDAGGYGFDPTADPNPDCPECAGEGIVHVVVADTREALSHPLYEGVKQTKDGIEIKIADRAKALEQVARHLQMFKDDVKLNASEDLIAAARAISAASPPITPQYARENEHRLDELDEGERAAADSRSGSHG
ncbi:terminase small subunit [Roseovarius aestuariivivens]|uniref:terminase small subunit n=1 Tax=Roseovarius aestuariivivens TaxID=1888910 RepID=UPI001080851F|nr:terminase small subunit [Roseovarius aestuariivivens]